MNVIESGTWFNGWQAVVHTAVIAVTGYLALLAIVRISGNRTLSSMNAVDFVVSVALGSLLARAILSIQDSLSQLVAGATILVALQWLLSVAGARSSRIHALITPVPKVLFENGVFNQTAMARQGVGQAELEAAVREVGFREISDVDQVVLETQGRISVVWRSPVER